VRDAQSGVHPKEIHGRGTVRLHEDATASMPPATPPRLGRPKDGATVWALPPTPAHTPHRNGATQAGTFSDNVNNVDGTPTTSEQIKVDEDGTGPAATHCNAYPSSPVAPAVPLRTAAALQIPSQTDRAALPRPPSVVIEPDPDADTDIPERPAARVTASPTISLGSGRTLSPTHISIQMDDKPGWGTETSTDPHVKPVPPPPVVKSTAVADQRNSIAMRSQAYASMAVVAALIAGISVTFLVESNFDSDGENSTKERLMQACVIGCLAVSFLSLYGTTVLSMQYYLVTRALGSVSASDPEEEEMILDEVMLFMANTVRVRHSAVKCVVLSVPLFTCVLALFGVAKAGLGVVGTATIGLSTLAFLFFLHAIVVQQYAFSRQGDMAVQVFDPIPDPSKPESKAPARRESLREAARQMMRKTNQKVSDFRRVW